MGCVMNRNASQSRSGGETTFEALKIMIVDDEEPMRLLVEMLLAREGHDVVWSVDDSEAMRLLDGDEDLQMDLVVTDLKMPTHDGWDVIRAARKRMPGVGVILMTGSPDPDLPHKVSLMDVCDLLRKPFRIAEFRKLVERMNLPGRTREETWGLGRSHCVLCEGPTGGL